MLKNIYMYTEVYSWHNYNFIFIMILKSKQIELVSFGPGDLGSIPGRVIQKNF